MITKSSYVNFRGCPRCYYYFNNNKEQAKPTDDIAQKRIDEGILVNDYAHLYFPHTIKVKDNLKSVDVQMQAEVTQKLLKDNNSCIAEASFIKDDLFCAVDLLLKDQDSYSIYEVKASTSVKSHLDEYCADVAFQKYVLEQCGLKINKCYILHLNKDYVRYGDLNIQQLLTPYCLDNEAHFVRECEIVETTINEMRKFNYQQLPNYGNCSKNCEFYNFCHKDLPQPNVLQLNHFNAAKAHELINQGIKSFEDISKNNVKLTAFQKIQLNTTLTSPDQPHVDIPAIKEFLQSLKYPIYHLDFETMHEAVPKFDGVGPYQQVPFQYSLHIEITPGGELIHKEFLGDKLNCEYELAKQLCNDIPLDATSMAYNMTFEKSVLKHLAQHFPDLANHLMNIHDHLIDLLVPFRKAIYYNSKQGGSNSIKYVMPAICPEMQEAYHQLPVVHNGGEALSMFPKLVNMSGEEYNKVRQGMLDYCCLDTLSMVKVLNALWKLAK